MRSFAHSDINEGNLNRYDAKMDEFDELAFDFTMAIENLCVDHGATLGADSVQALESHKIMVEKEVKHYKNLMDTQVMQVRKSVNCNSSQVSSFQADNLLFMKNEIAQEALEVKEEEKAVELFVQSETDVKSAAPIDKPVDQPSRQDRISNEMREAFEATKKENVESNPTTVNVKAVGGCLDEHKEGDIDVCLESCVDSSDAGEKVGVGDPKSDDNYEEYADVVHGSLDKRGDDDMSDSSDVSLEFKLDLNGLVEQSKSAMPPLYTINTGLMDHNGLLPGPSTSLHLLEFLSLYGPQFGLALIGLEPFSR